MTEVTQDVERRRLEVGLSQKAVAARLGISQPHYSKVVGGVVTLTDDLASLMAEWLNSNPVAVMPSGDRRLRIRELSRSIERDLRRLNSLISEESGSGRRSPQRTRDRRPTAKADD